MRANLALASAFALALAAFGLLLSACGRPSGVAGVPIVAAGDEVTFLVAADTHFGPEGMYERNVRQVEAMNALPGAPWPTALGGVVSEPAALIVAGDLTDLGHPAEWWAFSRVYGFLRGQGLLRYPVFVGTGNHDQGVPLLRIVPGAVEFRHGSRDYAIRLGGLHVIGLDVYPDATALQWLRAELERVGPEQPVLLWFHYPLAGPYSDWWTDEEKQAFRDVVEGYGVVAVFHGHYHRSGHYEWRGLQVYNVGSPRHSDHSFAVVRWRAGRLDVAAWDWARGDWAWHHTTRREAGEVVVR